MSTVLVYIAVSERETMPVPEVSRKPLEVVCYMLVKAAIAILVVDMGVLFELSQLLVGSLINGVRKASDRFRHSRTCWWYLGTTVRKKDLAISLQQRIESSIRMLWLCTTFGRVGRLCTNLPA